MWGWWVDGTIGVRAVFILKVLRVNPGSDAIPTLNENYSLLIMIPYHR